MLFRLLILSITNGNKVYPAIATVKNLDKTVHVVVCVTIEFNLYGNTSITYLYVVFCLGSEYDSDENIDLAEEDDIMEAELGDADVTATEDELRDQVGRAHL